MTLRYIYQECHYGKWDEEDDSYIEFTSTPIEMELVCDGNAGSKFVINVILSDLND
jgi:hypothetical protein